MAGSTGSIRGNRQIARDFGQTYKRLSRTKQALGGIKSFMAESRKSGQQYGPRHRRTDSQIATRLPRATYGSWIHSMSHGNNSSSCGKPGTRQYMATHRRHNSKNNGSKRNKRSEIYTQERAITFSLSKHCYKTQQRNSSQTKG